MSLFEALFSYMNSAWPREMFGFLKRNALVSAVRTIDMTKIALRLIFESLIAAPKHACRS